MMNNKIALITDSGCDLPDETLTQYDIGLVPLYIIWGREELRDREDITPVDFYERLASDPVHPTTSQPHPQDFVRAIEQAQENGADEAVIITISSGMSSTYASAVQAQRQTGLPVHVVDSKANSLSQGFEVLAAARARESGGSAQDMVAAADRVRQNLATMLYVDTLEYLHRGGRIGRARMWLGTALNLKPQLYVDHATGRIEPGTRARSRKQALEKLYQAFFDRMDTSKPLHVGILHGNTPDEAEAWADRIRREYNPAELLIGMTSPMMGVHTGPGALALCGYSADE
ncbi:MAG: DegV family protein [Anaerolineae bacterium]|nr:DegV family protein [Anaerolineae bacterium]